MIFILCYTYRVHLERRESKEQKVTKDTLAPLVPRVLLEHLERGYAC